MQGPKVSLMAEVSEFTFWRFGMSFNDQYCFIIFKLLGLFPHFQLFFVLRISFLPLRLSRPNWSFLSFRIILHISYNIIESFY